MKIKCFSFTVTIAFLVALLTSAQAQTPRMNTINITAEADKVHVAAQGDVVEMRIEVVSEAGDVVFESGAITGNTLDWNMKDAQGERVAAGTYMATVTFRTAAGKSRKRVEQVTVDEAVKTETKAVAAPQAVQAAIDGAGTVGKISKFTDVDTIANSIITESAGNIGIGAVPQTGYRLDVAGWARITPSTAGDIRFGTPNAETGMSIVRGTTGRADVRFDGHTLKLLAGTGNTSPCCGMFITTAGNIGIGTTAPTAKLEIAAQNGLKITGYQPYLTLSDRGILSYVQSVGGVLVFKPGGNQAAVMQSNGNVGIGTAAPAHRLSLIGGPTWTSNEWTGALELGNASAIGWQGNSGGQRFGIGQSTGGLYFFHTASNPGTIGSPANYDLAIGDGGELHAFGNAEQARDKGGFVKAMIFADPNGNMVRCYNSQLADGGASLPPSGGNGCGIKVLKRTGGSPSPDGVYDVIFNYRVNDRFVSITPEYDRRAASFQLYENSPNIVRVITYLTDIDGLGSERDTAFMLILY